jgi:hypothetical protein
VEALRDAFGVVYGEAIAFLADAAIVPAAGSAVPEMAPV